MGTTKGRHLLALIVATVALVSWLTAVGSAPADARPFPPGGANATLVIKNQTGWPLQLNSYPYTDASSGSSSPDRWIDRPAQVLQPGQTTVARAWSTNPVHFSVTVDYSYNYRFGSTYHYVSSLAHQWGMTWTAGSKASQPGEQVIARVYRDAPNMAATYTLQ